MGSLQSPVTLFNLYHLLQLDKVSSFLIPHSGEGLSSTEKLQNTHFAKHNRKISLGYLDRFLKWPYCVLVRKRYRDIWPTGRSRYCIAINQGMLKATEALRRVCVCQHVDFSPYGISHLFLVWKTNSCEISNFLWETNPQEQCFNSWETTPLWFSAGLPVKPRPCRPLRNAVVFAGSAQLFLISSKGGFSECQHHRAGDSPFSADFYLTHVVISVKNWAVQAHLRNKSNFSV